MVISDWNGTHDTLQAAYNGLDLEMGTERPYDDFFLARPFRDRCSDGVVPMTLLDDKVRRNLRVMFRTKAFEGRAEGAINTPRTSRPPAAIAEQAMVLLKNDGGLLPLNPARVRSIAVIGENATRKQAHGGGSSRREGVLRGHPARRHPDARGPGHERGVRRGVQDLRTGRPGARRQGRGGRRGGPTWP